MKTTRQLQEYVKARPGITPQQLQKNLHQPGFTIEMARAALAGQPVAPNPVLIQPPNRPPVRVKVKTLEDFRKAHDNPQKIRNGLASLRAGAYLTEEEFRQFCSIPANLWRRNAELPEFSDNHLKVAGVVHWASKSTIQEMKSIIGAA